MSVAGAGGGADAGADTAGVHASDGWEVGVVEDGELEGQSALDAVAVGEREREGEGEREREGGRGKRSFSEGYLAADQNVPWTRFG